MSAARAAWQAMTVADARRSVLIGVRKERVLLRWNDIGLLKPLYGLLMTTE
jgi:hypothetical protein